MKEKERILEAKGLSGNVEGGQNKGEEWFD